MISRFRPKSEFSRNVLTLMTGTTIAQAIPIAISPILTRIYTPEDFGVYAIFVSITSIAGSIANGRYELAIMLPKEDDDAINIAALGLLIALTLSIVLLFTVIAFNHSIALLLGNKEIAFWLYLVPTAVLLTGIFNVLTYYNTRIRAYNDIASRTIYKSLILAAVQLTTVLYKPGPGGLIGGVLASNLFANAKLLRNSIQGKDLRIIISKQKMLVLAKKYIDFPRFTLWATLANSASIHLVSVLITTYHSVTTLGLYSLSERVIGIPSVIAGGSISQVYFQHASAEKKATGSAKNAFTGTVKKLILLAIPFYVIMFFTVEGLFAIVFGEKWRLAGQYSKILLPLFFIRFIFSPLSITFSTFERQKLALLLQVGLLSASLSTIFVSGFLRLSFSNFLYVYTSVMSLYYLFFLFVAKQVSSPKK